MIMVYIDDGTKVEDLELPCTFRAVTCQGMSDVKIYKNPGDEGHEHLGKYLFEVCLLNHVDSLNPTDRFFQVKRKIKKIK